MLALQSDRAAVATRWGAATGADLPERFFNTDRALAENEQLLNALRTAGQAGSAAERRLLFDRIEALRNRVRMNDVAADDGVFIRSMATRGALGGLSAAVADGADVLEAAGFDRVLIETVGVGQSELDVARLADSTIVVVTPDSGDEVQTAKAGLMEIADVLFVLICIANREGIDLDQAFVRMMAKVETRDAGRWTRK